MPESLFFSFCTIGQACSFIVDVVYTCTYIFQQVDFWFSNRTTYISISLANQLAFQSEVCRYVSSWIYFEFWIEKQEILHSWKTQGKGIQVKLLRQVLGRIQYIFYRVHSVSIEMMVLLKRPFLRNVQLYMLNGLIFV